MLAHDLPSQEISRPWKWGLVLSMSGSPSYACKYEFCLQPHFGFLHSLTYVLKWHCNMMAAFHRRALEGADFPLELIF